MASRESRSRKSIARSRQYLGEREASFLISALNSETVVSSEELPKIVVALREIADLTPITGRQLMSGDPAIKTNQAKVDVVNAYLRRFEAVPVVALPSTASLKRVRMEWQITHQSAVDKKQLFDCANLELAAILSAITLTQMKRIGAVRQCGKCGRWFFARFSHSRFCSDDCKNLFHQEDEATRERKRVKARDNYKFKLRK